MKRKIQKGILAYMLALSLFSGGCYAPTSAVYSDDLPADLDEPEDLAAESVMDRQNTDRSVKDDDFIDVTSSMKITAYSDFSDDYAWIQYDLSDSVDSQRQIALIDKDGKIQDIRENDRIFYHYAIEEDTRYSGFIDGYATINYGYGVYFIDEDFNHYGYTCEEAESILAAEGGYMLIGRTEASYDTKMQFVELYNAKGELLDQVERDPEDIKHISYLGKGFFSGWDMNASADSTGFIFGEKGGFQTGPSTATMYSYLMDNDATVTGVPVLLQEVREAYQ